MIFPSDFEQRLGFDQLRERLRATCLGEPGKRQVEAMQFSSHPKAILQQLQLVHETVALSNKESLPVGPYADPEPWQKMLQVEGGFLEVTDLAAMMAGLTMAVDANNFLLKDAEHHPMLSGLALPASNGKKVLSRLRAVIDDEGKIRDNASPDLSRIRKRMREEERKARQVADHIMRQALESGWSPEGAHPTIREGRLVIPLHAEHKRKIKGYLTDQSATGQTVFLEPADVLEANNDLRDTLLEERRELVRILNELTALVRVEVDEVNAAFDLLADLDFLKAKARLANDLSATLPVLVEKPSLEWRDARHPLLYLSWKGKRKLEPLQVALSDADRFLLVSGPNAGGKSVCLKTVGLLQYMLQCGLLVPMNADSVVGIFESIFLDIGDQQSIESDLSTYSSHLKNMAVFIRDGNANSLVLMDELGSGTDPNFGGGIAQAILEQLLTRRVWGLATTHYYNLKVFASHTPGIRNASMLFDSENLAPLFKLAIGPPGSSFALEIAAKTGLPDETLKAAHRIIGNELIGLETLVKEVTEEKAKLDLREREVALREKQSQATLNKYEMLNEKLETERKEILNRAKAEASSLLSETNKEIEKTIRHIRENKAEKQETRKAREGLRELTKKVKPQSPFVPRLQGPLKEGDKVRLSGGEVTGTILSMKRTTAMVQFGSIRSTVKIDRLVRSDQAELKVPSGTGTSYVSRTDRFSPQLDVRGMRADELVPALIRFIDDAVQLGLKEVSVLHGKGEGVLRTVARDYLKSRKEVASCRDAHADRGGAGITLVELK